MQTGQDKIRVTVWRTVAMKKLMIIVVSMLTLAATGAALAGEIYKWTDKDGNVHYGDRPEGERPEIVGIASKPTDPARVQAMTQARAEVRTQAAEEAAAAAAAGPSPQELQAEARERAERCSAYRERLQSFVTSRRLYREDDNGERVYLDEDETRAARERVEGQIDEYCNS